LTSKHVEIPKDVINLILEKISKIFPKLKNENLSTYLLNDSFVNQDIYQEYLSYLPDPHPLESLSAKFPDVSKQWDYHKNFPLVPENISPQTNKLFWWRCEKGRDHSWRASPNNRNSKIPTGCPFCSKKRPSLSYNLMTEFPDIASEWDFQNNSKRPEKYMPTSRAEVYWICMNMHSWKDKITNRTQAKKGSPCKACNSVEFKFPELTKEWHPTRNGTLKPSEISYGESRKVWWKCANSHEWEASPNNRTHGGKANKCIRCKREVWSSEGWPMHKARSKQM